MRTLHWLMLGTALVALAGCATMPTTVAQELAWERWKMCDRFPTVTLKEVRTDGQIWVWTTGGTDYAAYQQCIAKAAADQGARRVGVSPAAPGLVARSASVAPAAPLIRPGSEWAFRWESPQGEGTFVYILDREEVRDGSTWYVLKSGNRELYYRKDDLAIALDLVNGEPEIRRSPPLAFLKWPLTVGQEWEQSFTTERPKERQTYEILAVCKIEREENVTVPRGRSTPSSQSAGTSARAGSCSRSGIRPK